MLNLGLGRPAGSAYRVFCLGAHSDDIEIGCGGTLLALLERHNNVVVHWIVFSSNEERAGETRASANAFLDRALEKEVVVKEFRDGFFPFLGGQIKDEFEALEAGLRSRPGLHPPPRRPAPGPPLDLRSDVEHVPKPPDS